MENNNKVVYNVNNAICVSFAKIDMGDLIPQYRIAAHDKDTEFIIEHKCFRGKRAKEIVPDFLADWRGALDDDKLKEAIKTVYALMGDDKLPEVKKDTKMSIIDVYKKVCDFVREHILDNQHYCDKDGNIVIRSSMYKTVVEQVCSGDRSKELKAFLAANDILRNNSGRDDIQVNKSDTNPCSYRAIRFKDYK